MPKAKRIKKKEKRKKEAENVEAHCRRAIQTAPKILCIWLEIYVMRNMYQDNNFGFMYN